MRRTLAFGGLLVCLGLTGCATMTSAPPASLAAEHRQRALAFERRGDLRSALEEWKIALTIDPTNAAARAEHARLTRRRQAAVARRIQAGQDALRRGSHLEGRRQLLAALALDPSNATAFTTLREQVPELHVTTHLVGRGETLGAIAERYYGDRALAEVIWEANRLPPTPQLVPGMRLKIPEVAGLAARTAGPRKVAPDTSGSVARESAADEPHLEGNPKHNEWLDLKKAILYNQGKEALVNGWYDDAHRALSQLARLDPAYRDGPGMLRDARNHAIQLHYNEGIRLSRDEQLEAAIAHWHAVLEHDPQHAEAKRNIEQAQRILRSLQERAQQ